VINIFNVKNYLKIFKILSSGFFTSAQKKRKKFAILAGYCNFHSYLIFLTTGLGVGEEPDSPEFISLIPMSSAKYTGLFPNYAEQFEIKLNTPISSKIL
jgi:hypothetical protein